MRHRPLLCIALAALLAGAAAVALRAPPAGAQITPSDAGQALLKDCSATLTTGSVAQLLLARNDNRHKVILKNVGAEVIGFSLTQTALTSTGLVATPGTFSLASGESWSSDTDLVPVNAIWWNAPTAGDIMACVHG